MLKGHLIPTREQLGARAARYAYPDTVGMSSAGVPPATLDPDELLGLARARRAAATSATARCTSRCASCVVRSRTRWSSAPPADSARIAGCCSC